MTISKLTRFGRGSLSGGNDPTAENPYRRTAGKLQTALLTPSASMLMILFASPFAATASDDPPLFEDDVLPIFTKYCFNCHGKSSPQVGLDLRTARLTMRGSQNGPVVVAGSPDASLLWRKISSREMPLSSTSDGASQHHGVDSIGR